ncbi:MAG: hypothetical protein PHT36_00525 [Patescibacteria group bacterium]|nr:hypothetical protein [Patescibacteria group bacterium]
MKLLINTKAILAAIVIATLGVLGTSAVFNPIGAASDVPIEGKLEIGNATQGTGPAKTINARVDDVVNITTWYHNIENADSGLIAENVNVRINIPGTKTKTHQITSRIAGTNTNVVTDLANVNTSIDTNLSYIPGTATRRYNAGTNANPRWVIESIPDSVVTTGYTVSRLRPCWNFQETINVQARVTASVISITKQVKIEGADGWNTNINAEPGSTLAYLITVKNEGNERLTNVIVRDSFPVGLDYVEGSARLISSNYPNGYQLSDQLIRSGVNIGNYGAGSGAYVRFNARVPENLSQCGDYRFTNVGVVRADQLGEYYNTAIVNTTNFCTTSEISIRIVKFHDRDGDGNEDSNEERLSGWRFRVTGPNGFETTTVTGENGIAPITGNLQPGVYTVTEILQSGWRNTTGITIQREVTEDARTQTFVFGNRRVERGVTPPNGGGDQLPSSGPLEAMAATFGTVSISGSVLAWIRSKKRLLGSFRK